MPSKQSQFLEEAIKSGIDEAVKQFPDAVSSEELASLKKLDKAKLQQILEMRKMIEEDDMQPMSLTQREHTGNGILSM